MKTCFLIIISIVTVMVAYGQKGILTGRVVHENQPVSFASIRFGSMNAIADSNGHFTLTALAPGKKNIYVSSIGFDIYQHPVNIKAWETTDILIVLEKQSNLLEDVVVTGTMKAMKKLESPIAVEVYTPQFFKKNPSASIFEGLQNVNGVRPQFNCNVCNTGDIHINGLEGPYTMITIDGMPIVSSLASVYGLFGIPTQMIERVEIVKGPASGLYGSEAIGGLINIITKDPQKAPVFTFSAMSNSWMEHNFDLGTKFNIGRSAVNLTGINYFNYQKPFDKNNDQFTDVTLQQRVSVFNKINFTRKYERAASIAGRFFYENRWGGDMRWNKTFRGGDSLYGESIYTKRFELIANYQLPVEEKMFFSISATAHDQDSYYGITPYMGKQYIGFGQTTWQKMAGVSHNLLIGSALKYNYYDDNSTATKDTATGKNQPEEYLVPGVFLQDEWNVNSRHHILLGMRYDHHPVHKSILTPRIAYKWTLNDKQVIRLNAGTGFRVVSLFTEEHAALTGSRSVEVKETLKPEKSYNVNLNYSRQWKTGLHFINIDASAWYSYFTNQIIADYDSHPNKIIYSNLKGHALSKGVTLNFEWNIGNRLKTLAGLTLQDVEKVEKDVSNKTIRQHPVLSENWSSTWSVSYVLPAAAITFDYTGNMYGPMRLPLVSEFDPRPSRSPVWSIQNIQVTKKFGQSWELFGGVKNLLNWTPAKHSPFLIARSHDPFDKKVEYNSSGKVIATAENPYALTFDPAYVYGPNQGIRAFLGLRFNLKK